MEHPRQWCDTKICPDFGTVEAGNIRVCSDVEQGYYCTTCRHTLLSRDTTKIQDVQVFGVPDATYSEELCAWVKLRAGTTVGADEVRAFCRGQIAHYKIPRHVRFVDEFPMTATGKVQKFLMREHMMA